MVGLRKFISTFIVNYFFSGSPETGKVWKYDMKSLLSTGAATPLEKKWTTDINENNPERLDAVLFDDEKVQQFFGNLVSNVSAKDFFTKVCLD